MALQFSDIKASQTASAPKYDQQGMLVSTPSVAPSTGFVGLQASQIPGSPTYTGSVTLNQMQPVTPITLPTPTPPQIPSTEAIEATQKSFQDYAKEQQAAYNTPENTQYSKALTDFLSLTAQNTGKETYRAQKEQELVSELQKQQSELNSQILTGIAQQKADIANYNQTFNALQSSPQQRADVVGSKQQELQRTFSLDQASKTADLNFLQARGAALNGQIQTAYTLVDRAVNAKYAPIEDELKIKAAQLDVLKLAVERSDVIISKAQEAQMKDLDRQYTEDQRRIAEEKAKSKTNMGLALEAGIQTKFVNKNGEFFDTNSGQAFANPQDFFKAAGVTSFAEAYQKGLITDFTIDKLADRDFVAQARAKYVDAGILPNDSVETATQKIKKSRIYQKETYIAPTGGSGGGARATGVGGTVTDLDILATAVSNKLSSVAAKNSFDAQYSKATTDEQKLKILASNVVLPTEIKNGIIQNTQVTKSLDDVLSMLNSGVKTGLLQAGQSYVANKLGTGGDKQVEAIKSKLITAVQPYRNKVTGAAWGDQEEAEYQALIGSVKFAPEDLANKINVFKDTLKQQSQTALLAGIDPLGAINSNSPIQNNPSLGGGGIREQVSAKGYDYDSMKRDGFSDEEIKQALGL